MLVIAHRGYSSRYPENSALAFEKAIEAGADYIETDLRFSRDGEIVCCHDPDLKRIAGRTEAIVDLTAEEIKKMPLTSGHSILSLNEVLDIARHRVRVMFDIKVPMADMLDRIILLLEDIGMTPDIIYGARDLDHAHTLKKRSPDIQILGMPKKIALIPDFIDAGVAAIRVWEEDLTEDIITTIKMAGVPVWVTAGLRGQGEAAGEITRERVIDLSRLGVDAVLANDPVSVRQSLEHGLKSEQRSARALI